MFGRLGGGDSREHWSKYMAHSRLHKFRELGVDGLNYSRKKVAQRNLPIKDYRELFFQLLYGRFVMAIGDCHL
jgi:hypothetical protein